MPDDLAYWGVFFCAALALNLSPGPDLLYILSRTLGQGKRVGIASALGVCSGALVHVAAAALGLSAILATSAWAFSLIKYVGAAYLLYLGIQALRSSGTIAEQLAGLGGQAAGEDAWEAARKAYWQGVWIDILNPKVAIFFMAFLPQFVRPGQGEVPLQLFVLGCLVIAVAVVVETLLVLAAARTRRFLVENRAASRWLDRLMGSVLLGLGLRLALTERS